MAYRKRILRTMPEKTRKLARLINELDSTRLTSLTSWKDSQ